MARRRTYEVRVTREDHWWRVHVPEIGGFTLSPRLSRVEPTARGYIAAFFEVPWDSFDIVTNWPGAHQAIDR